ncbi:hypothetical protein [Nocardia vulneris]|uniref:Uncharacterized protein n=1 Tax=Nocardia vulneris TaxID=1141657 RepID=A0ABR4ZCP2_9NOCA|nr:hypothetical protein [Nocardia vulneris]KIA63041.1 hypothetical protein FG87_22035 [Nocardia vulneris]
MTATDLTERVVVEQAALEHGWVINREGFRTEFTRGDRQFRAFWDLTTGRCTGAAPAPWMGAPTSYLAEWLLETLTATEEPVDPDDGAADRGHDQWVDRQVGL